MFSMQFAHTGSAHCKPKALMDISDDPGVVIEGTYNISEVTDIVYSCSTDVCQEDWTLSLIGTIKVIEGIKLS